MQTNRFERISYGSFFGGQNLILIIVLNFLMFFYTDIVKIDPGIIFVLFLVARIWDAVNDPIMGIIIDKTSFKSGEKFKPWINSAIFLLPIITILLFMNPLASPDGKVAWAFTTYIIWGMIYTVSDIPIFALATVMTSKPDERVNIISIGRLAAGLGGLVGAVLITPLSIQFGWTAGVAVACVIAFIIMLPVRFKAVERIEWVPPKRQDPMTILKDIKKNIPLLVVFGSIIITHLTNTGSTTLVHFVKYNIGNEALVPVFALVAASSAIILPLFLAQLIHTFGKRKVYLVLMSFSTISSIVYYFVGYGNLTLVLLFTAFKYIALNLPILMMAMFTSDCIEWGHKITGAKHTGTIFSVQTFSIKLTLALQGILGAGALAYAQYNADVPMTPFTLNEIWKMNSLYPVFGQILAIIVFFLFYKLSEKEVAHVEAAKSLEYQEETT